MAPTVMVSEEIDTDVPKLSFAFALARVKTKKVFPLDKEPISNKVRSMDNLARKLFTEEEYCTPHFIRAFSKQVTRQVTTS